MEYLRIVYKLIIKSMTTQPLLPPAKIQTKSEVRLLDMPLITRYNIFIENYNHPSLKVNNAVLHQMPESSVHNNTFQVMTDWKGKTIFGILLFLPILDCFLFLLSVYCLLVYFRCLKIHKKNLQAVDDPLKNMVYDHDLCYKLRKDFYAFTIEFKQLQGFALNYNRDVRKEMLLRQERGKANFFIYNGNFWASYNHFGKWKHSHIGMAAISGIMAIAVNVIFFLFVCEYWTQ